RARRVRLGRGRSVAGTGHTRDRSVLEELRRAGGAVRRPLRAVAAGDRRPCRGRCRAVAAELRPDPRGHPRPRGGDRCRARRGDREALDVGLRGLRPHVEARDARRAARVGSRQRGARRCREPDMRLGVEAAIVAGELVAGDVEIADGAIVACARNGKRGSGIAVPGFVDLHVNGFGGVDFLSADARAYARAGEALLETGVTAFRPTFITAPEEELTAALAEVANAAPGPRVVGVHLEGPFLSPQRLGIHPPEHRRDPDPALLGRLLAAGDVGHVTLAPELPGALDLVELLHARGVAVSLGHSDATVDEANAAFDRGVRTVTHLFNAMRPIQARDGGLAGAALAREDVDVQLILDGHHLAAETARLAWRVAAGRLALVTDAGEGASLGDGRYRLGPVEVEVQDG